MKPILLIGISIVHLALLSYTIAIIILARKKNIGTTYLTFLTIGVILDITSTICMMIASTKGIITIHGLVGYSALLAMITDSILCYRYAFIHGNLSIISPFLKKFSLVTYFYWIIAYVTGAIIVMIK